SEFNSDFRSLLLGDYGCSVSRYAGCAFPRRYHGRRPAGYNYHSLCSHSGTDMKVLFGVQGTGNGHISRARAMAPALREHGIEVDFLFSGRPADRYFDMEIFGNYQLRTGLSFVVKNGRINYLQTIRQAKL